MPLQFGAEGGGLGGGGGLGEEAGAEGGGVFLQGFGGAGVLQAVEQAKALKAELVIGFGGGSSMDVAKLVALLAHPDCKQALKDIYGVGNARGRRLPLIQVPTTAATGIDAMVHAIEAYTSKIK